jgi:hypothetical protein
MSLQIAAQIPAQLRAEQAVKADNADNAELERVRCYWGIDNPSILGA